HARFSPDGRLLVTVGTDRIVRLWHLTARHPFQQPLDPTDFVLHDPAGHYEATADFAMLTRAGGHLLMARSGALRVWDLANGRQLGTQILYDGKALIASLSDDRKRVGLTDFADTTRVHAWSLPEGDVIGRGIAVPEGDLALSFSPDGGRFLTLDNDAESKEV